MPEKSRREMLKNRCHDTTIMYLEYCSSKIDHCFIKVLVFVLLSGSIQIDIAKIRKTNRKENPIIKAGILK